jgi:hypothetical protein
MTYTLATRDYLAAHVSTPRAMEYLADHILGPGASIEYGVMSDIAAVPSAITYAYAVELLDLYEAGATTSIDLQMLQLVAGALLDAIAPLGYSFGVDCMALHNSPGFERRGSGDVYAATLRIEVYRRAIPRIEVAEECHAGLMAGAL